MEKLLEERINLTIDNYRNSKIDLRNDGDLINHFASLVFAHYEKEIPFEKVKEIRKYIKATSSRVSPFRGDILYILSILVALEENQKQLIESLYESYDILKNEGFKECDYLVLTSFVLAKYANGKDKEEIAQKMKEVFILLKDKYYNITGEDDYLVCALWALNDIDINTIDEFIEAIYNYMTNLNIKSKNGIQSLTNAIMLNGSSGHMYRTIEFILQLEKREIKLAQQFLPLLGVLSNRDIRKSVDLIEGVIDKLCDEESEYEYYMDKGFRTIIAITIISFTTINEKRSYIDELLAQGVYCFIKSKNKGMFAEALA
ncbi:DUF4003 domain-containing protein [Clostridium sp. Sa3CUN1]|uniref:DUF4003 domain-containing protein n=1 Tax=Clostridium gallinarum TaxID=2762246 RepID=A0ABR8Q7Z8_9CLOT|nr:DUF4003 family protein [Clostridium gallinarum]MBD7916542.1 DUF4003 domain-containing protein [Clostridium gallinarum]